MEVWETFPIGVATNQGKWLQLPHGLPRFQFSKNSLAVGVWVYFLCFGVFIDPVFGPVFDRGGRGVAGA
ncbi:hypothetical protein Q3G72_012855 [Acer saccharum]|nr:hypothetical protein Q3G72_012855 [Acer saccharum]